MEFSQEKFNQIKQGGEAFYATIGEVHCPYFSEKIKFNESGLGHLLFKHREKRRSEQDQYMRFKLLQVAPEILKLSRTVQGILEINRFEKVRTHGRNEVVMKLVRYFEFIAVIKRNRIKLIIKQVGDGEKFFWSIIPFWGMNTETMTRILHEGDPESD